MNEAMLNTVLMLRYALVAGTALMLILIGCQIVILTKLSRIQRMLSRVFRSQPPDDGGI